MEYTKDQLTEWKTEKPMLPGVYQQLCGLGKDVGYQRWDGKYWYAWSENKIEAEKYRISRYEHRGEKWRGLNFDPSLKND